MKRSEALLLKAWGCLSLAACVLFVGCAAFQSAQKPDDLLNDHLFSAPSLPIKAEEVFALSKEMRHFLRREIAGQLLDKSPYRALFDALYSKGQLKLEYDNTMTRNASQAFAQRAGNCLSLVIMTAAFAKELGLEIQYQSALTTEAWSRTGNLYLRSGHVNLTLGRRHLDPRTGLLVSPLKIDFLPPEEIRGLRTRTISEQTVVAMYMNNRAAEALVAGQIDDAYWLAREAVNTSYAFLSSFNTLGVVYLRHGDLREAERVFRYMLDREPTNTVAMSNLAQALRQQGRTAESDAIQRRLTAIEPYPPFHFFDLGLAAMQRGDYQSARDLFKKEIARDAYHHEFHFWLGVANARLGDQKRARDHLSLAIDYSTNQGERDLYAAKLDSIRAQDRR
jgi:Flp pilus assembly protein TadD